MQLRRLPIISVIPVSAAWLIIFLHSVIPHTHITEMPRQCKWVIHCCHEHPDEIPGPGDSSRPVTASLTDSNMHQSDGHNHFVCHFTTTTIHPLDNFQPFYTDNSGITLDPLPAVQLRQNCGDEVFLALLLSMQENLRAPPAFRG